MSFTHLLIALTLLVWGTAGIFDKLALSRSCNRTVFVVFHLFNLPLLLVLSAVAYCSGGVSWNGALWAWQAAAGGCGVLAVVLYLTAMKRTDASYVLGITAAYPVISSLIAAPLLGEPLSAGRLAGAALVSFGVALIGFTPPSSGKRLSKRDWLVVAPSVIIAAILWGAIGVFEKLAVAHGPELEAYIAECAWELLFAMALWSAWHVRGTRLSLRDLPTWRFGWLSAAGVAVGNYAVLLLFARETAGYAIVLTACYPLVMYVLAVTFLKEKLNTFRVLGIVCVVAGGVLTELLKIALG